MNTKTIKICAGEYEVRPLPLRSGNLAVSISRVEYWDGPAWIAAAMWDNARYTDPLRTKRDAVFNARVMLSTAEDM
jgi:hypothetical protein